MQTRAISVGWRERLYLQEPKARATTCSERLGRSGDNATLSGANFAGWECPAVWESGVAYLKPGLSGNRLWRSLHSTAAMLVITMNYSYLRALCDLLVMLLIS
jgi:hypothetical protein